MRSGSFFKWIRTECFGIRVRSIRLGYPGFRILCGTPVVVYPCGLSSLGDTDIVNTILGFINKKITTQMQPIVAPTTHPIPRGRPPPRAVEPTAVAPAGRSGHLTAC